jgi:hypothetical protein
MYAITQGGKRHHETPAERERRETLEKARRIIAIEAMRDNDDLYGLDEDEPMESESEPLPETDSEWEEDLSTVVADTEKE